MSAEGEQVLELPGLIFPHITYQIDPSPGPASAQAAVLSISNATNFEWRLRRVDLTWNKNGRTLKAAPLTQVESVGALENKTLVLLLRPVETTEETAAEGGLGEAEFETVWGIVRQPFTGH
jgi:hypothetical protein